LFASKSSTSASNFSIRGNKSTESPPDGVVLTDVGAPMYFPIDKRGDDATRPTVAVPVDTDVPAVVPVAASDDAAPVAPDTDTDGRRPPVVRNDPARDDVAAAADVYVLLPPIVRTVGAANAPIDTAAPQINDIKDIFTPTCIYFFSCNKLYHSFDLIPKTFFYFFLNFFNFFYPALKFISQTNRE
jgi:hypothetical protein